jgi:histidine triad (HIT) family protein
VEENRIESENTVFAKIIRREIPADIVYEDADILAFRDIQPVAPTHILIIPKCYVRDLSSCEDSALLGKLLTVSRLIAKQEKLSKSGYRVVINTGGDGGQTVFHLHLHLLAGRALSWPPG